jgi:hypothetical protein
MIIFQMDGGGPPTASSSDLEQFSVFEPHTWKMFEKTGHYRYLEELSLYIPEKHQRTYDKAFKDYMSRVRKDVYYPGTDYEDEVRETRKEA